MGIQWCFSVLFLVVMGAVLVKTEPASNQKSASGFLTDACQISGCNCTVSANIWTIINCTLGNTQRVEFAQNSIPSTTLELCISGGEEIIFHSEAFKSLQGFSLIRIDGSKRLTICKNSFLELASASLLIQIQGCDSFNVETYAFKNSQASLSIEIFRCSYISIQKSAFSRLKEGKFHDISFIDLKEEAFNFENQALLKRHGPVAAISFHNVIIPKVLKETFTSSLAELNIKNSEIREIHSEAFRANQISSISIKNSTIHKIHAGAFSDRTILFEFILSKSKIHLLESKAVMASMTNLTVEHSKIAEIQTGAINSSVARVMVTDNEIGNFEFHGLVPREWNYVKIEDNIIKCAHNSFLDLECSKVIKHKFTFTGNEIYETESGSLSFLPDLKLLANDLKFDNNFFNETCHCNIDKWAMALLNTNNTDASFILRTSFCTINALLARCFELQEGLINMYNFTQLVCGEQDTIKCEHYLGQTKILDKSTFVNQDLSKPNSGFILAIVLGAMFIIAMSATILILLIRGSLWLKRKGYCITFRSLRYHQEQTLQEDEGTIVPIESSDKLDIPEELTPEILQRLREQLEDPNTHDEAREMIERLYELFIMGDTRHEEEPHLYEELGNLQKPQTSQLEKNDKKSSEYKKPFGFLKMMEEKYNNTAGKLLNETNLRPALAGDYSEPTDTAIHLYSELHQNRKDSANTCTSGTPTLFNSDTVKSNNSLKMASRPLPQKPNTQLVPKASSSNI